jgi:hypothetical protein
MAQILILCIPLLIELVRESYMFIVLKKPDNHVGSTLLRFVLLLSLSGVVAWFYPEYNFWLDFVRAFVYGASFYVLFDPLLNLIRYHIGKQRHVTFFYYGSSWTDGIMKRLPPYGQIMLRLWIYGVGHAFYWQTDLIFPQL